MKAAALQARLAAHKRHYGSVLASWTVQIYPDRASVLAAEAAAIEHEHPAFNLDHPQVEG